jgi:transposase
MRGRRPAGLDYVDRLRDYDEETRQRVKVVLQTMFEGLSVNAACAILKISPQRFHQLREDFIREGLEGIKPRPKGRPKSLPSPQQQEMERLQQELADARVELRAAQARAEIATVLPRVLQTPPKPSTEPPAESPSEEKKTRRRHRL